MEYTKGEWKAESLFDRYRVEYDAFGTICDIWATGEEAKANAHLIAAAPAMYEALKGIIDKRLESHETEAAYIPSEIERAYQALAKAEGK